MHSTTSSSTALRNIALAIFIAVAWITMAHFFRHEGDTDPVDVRRALSALGLWFVACGAWAYARVRSPLSHLFLWYGVLSGVHWGGPIGIGTNDFQPIELVVFIVLGTVAPQALFVDLARQAGPLASGERVRWRWLPYLPVLSGGVFVLMMLARPAEEAWPAIFPIFYLVGIILSFIGGLIWIARPFASKGHRFGYAVVAASILIGWIPHALASGGVVDASGYEGFFNLPLALVPLALAWYVGVYATAAVPPQGSQRFG